MLRQVFAGRASLMAPALASPDARLRGRVMKLIEALATEESMGALGTMVAVLEGQERLRLVQVIARSRCDTARTVLSGLIADPNDEVRRTAIRALGMFEGGMNTTQVRSLIADKTFEEKSLEEKRDCSTFWRVRNTPVPWIF